RVSARLFSDNGVQGSSLARLAAAMGMSKAFIYHYVSSKEQLIEEITLDTQQRLFQRTVARMGGTASHAEKVRLFMVEYAAFLDENFHEMRTANFSFAGHMSEGAAIRARQNNRDHLRLIVEVFEAGVAAGELVAVDPWLSARAVFSLTHSLARWYRPGEGKPAVSYAEDFFAVIARGVLPQPQAAGAAGGAGGGGAGNGNDGNGGARR
ncbi:MAG: TetR family transcriptional regulator, partial [Rhodobacteraceae bacterium]|nr:TetR family transcriptional regulator [Paracoccaceae bacterium]